MGRKTSQLKYKKAPGAPKRFKSAFIFFSQFKHKEIRQQCNGKVRAAFAAKCVSQAWKSLSSEDRKIYDEQARRDRERFDREKAAYKGPWKILDVKDHTAPKKPMSAFLAFSNERRREVGDANPHLTNPEVSSLLSKMWKAAPEVVKKAYRDREACERIVFKKAFAEWETQRDEQLCKQAVERASSKETAPMQSSFLLEPSSRFSLLAAEEPQEVASISHNPWTPNTETHADTRSMGIVTVESSSDLASLGRNFNGCEIPMKQKRSENNRVFRDSDSKHECLATLCDGVGPLSVHSDDPIRMSSMDELKSLSEDLEPFLHVETDPIDHLLSGDLFEDLLWS